MKLTMYPKKIEKQNEVHPKNTEIGNATIVLQQKLNTRKKHEEMDENNRIYMKANKIKLLQQAST
jgi:hypothetical protein